MRVPMEGPTLEQFEALRRAFDDWRKAHALPFDFATGLVGELFTITFARCIAELRFATSNVEPDDLAVCADVVSREIAVALRLSCCVQGQRPAEIVRAKIEQAVLAGAMSKAEAAGAIWALDKLDAETKALIE